MTLLPPSRHPALRLPRPALVALLVGGLVFGTSCGGDGGGPNGPPAVEDLVAITTPPATGVVGTGVVAKVRALDENGDPVEGTTIFWTVLAGAGQVAESTTTDLAGESAVTWHLGTVPGTNTLRALAPGATPIQFNVTGTVGPIDTLVRLTVVQQAGFPGQGIAVLPQIQARDTFGNPVPSAQITVVATGGATATPTPVTTDAEGKASVATWTLGAQSGITDTLQFTSVNGVTARFYADVIPPGPTVDTLVLVTAPPVTATVGTGVVVKIRALDTNGDSLPGATIVWAVLVGGGSAPASTITGPDGTTQIAWQVGNVAGTGTLRASASGVTPLVMNLTQTAGPIAALQRMTLATQVAGLGQAVAIPPKVKAIDAFANPVPNTPLAVTTTGGSATPADTLVTDSTGQAAVASWTLGVDPGATDTLTFTAATGPIVRFFGTHPAAPVTVDSLAFFDIPADSGYPSQSVTVSVRAFKTNGSPVANGKLTWTVISGEGKVPATTLTDATGASYITWPLSSSLTTDTLEVSAPGAAPRRLVIVVRDRPVVYQLWRGSADFQTGTVLQKPPITPRIIAVDSNGHGLPDVWIYVNAQKGSTVAEDSVLTDASGEAVISTWVLGKDPVPQTSNEAYRLNMVARTAGGGSAFASYYSGAVAYSGPPLVTITEGYPYQVIGNSMLIEAVVASGAPITNAVAFVNDSMRPMTLRTQGGVAIWTVNFPTAWAPYETLTVKVRAAANTGATDEATIPVVHRPQPAGAINVYISDPEFTDVLALVQRVDINSTAPQKIDSMILGFRDSTIKYVQTGDGWNSNSGQYTFGVIDTLDLSSYADGPLTFTLTAYGQGGATGSTSHTWELNRPPTITFDAPLSFTVADPTVQVSATCLDGGLPTCTRTDVFYGGTAIAIGASSVSGSGTLAPMEGQAVALRASGSDGISTVYSLPRTVYVESNSNLDLATTMPGRVLAYDGSRILWYRTDTSAVILQNVGGSVVATMAIGDSETVRDARLFPGGASFHHNRTGVSGLPSLPQTLTYVGSQGRVDVVLDSLAYRIGGKYLIRAGSTQRIDMSTGGGVTVTGMPSGAGVPSPEGDVAFLSSTESGNAQHPWVYLWSGGLTVKIFENASDSLHNERPQIGGGVVAWTTKPDAVSGVQQLRILRVYDGVVTIVDSNSTVGGVEGGWLAYHRQISNIQQVFTRSPAGVKRQVTNFGSFTTLEALASDGQVIVKNLNRRYWVGTASLTTVDVGSANFGRDSWYNGSFREALGRNAYTITP